MDIKEILARVDHTLLSVTATWEEIKKTLDEAIKYRTASACIPPCFVRRAKEYVGDKLAICTVIGFPNGYNSTASKVFETADAVKNGADEIDMVINVGALKEGETDYVTSEIREVKKACGDKILKVIIETCLLTDEQKIVACKAVTAAGADFIKTSTGFSLGGATAADVAILRANVGKNVKVKAAGGIKSLKDAENFIALGADRLGTSRIVGLVESRENQNSSDSGKRE
ncbi:MAG: deoxyribose-phosphate aldolase [Candidatus Neoclostridium sp.]